MNEGAWLSMKTMIVAFDGFISRIETLIAVYWLGNVKRVSVLGTNLLKQVFGPRVSVLGAKETIRASKRIPSMTVIFSFVELFWALWQIPAVLSQFLRPLEYLRKEVIRLLRQECFDGERLRGSGLRSWRGFLLRLPHAWRRFALHARRAVALDLGRRTNSPVQNVG